jgi:hypothetical protein
VGRGRRKRRTKSKKSEELDRRSPPFAEDAKDGATSSTVGLEFTRLENARLLIAEGVNGIELGGTRSRIKASGKTDKNGEGNGGKNEPPRDGRKFDGIKILAFEIDVGAEGESATDEPAEQNAENSAEETHNTGLDKEELLNVGVGSTEGFEDANFAAAFEDGHHQSVDDAESGDGKSEAAKNSEKKIEDGEEGAEGFAGVEEREGVEAHGFDGIFERLGKRSGFRANRERSIRNFVGGIVADDVAKIVDLSGAKSGSGVERHEQTSVAVTAEALGGLGFDDANNFEVKLFGDYGKAATATGRIG